jgi:hypothetical protein
VFRAYSERAKNIFNFLAALQSGAKEHADKRKIKARIRGQNMESLMGVSPYLRLIYGPNTGQNM